MDNSDVEVQVQKQEELEDIPVSAHMSESKDYVDDIKWPEISDLDVPGSFIDENKDFYSKDQCCYYVFLITHFKFYFDGFLSAPCFKENPTLQTSQMIPGLKRLGINNWRKIV